MPTKPTHKQSTKPTPAEVPAKPLTVLQQAELLINGQRQQDYGDKLSNFTQIAMLFTGVLARKLLPTESITPDDVALLMMQVKIARLAKSRDHKDSIVDIAGYVGCLDKLQDERELEESSMPDCLLREVMLAN